MVTLVTPLTGQKMSFCVQNRSVSRRRGCVNSRRFKVVAAAGKKIKKGDEPESKPTKLDPQAQRALEISQMINKKYGEGTCTEHGTSPPKVERLSSGDPYLDWGLSGGFAKGRIVEIYGPNSAGKSTLCLLAIASAQKNGEMAAYIDVENSFDPDYARMLGVNVDLLQLVNGSDCGETALDVADTLTREGIGIIVVDSVSALVPKAELEGNIGDVSVGLQARLMSKALRTLTPSVNRAKCVLIFINQLRQKIGVMYGNPETTSGGQALPFYASQRIDVRALKGDIIKSDIEKDLIIGQKIRCKIIKNKVGLPGRTAWVSHYFGSGIDTTESLVGAAIELKIVKKSGTWFMFGKQKVQGQDRFVQTVKQAPELELSLRKALDDFTQGVPVDENFENQEEELLTGEELQE